ncbi:MAG: copper homeostasis periplasmic binding protein CopC [Sphingobium sp.]
MRILPSIAAFTMAAAAIATSGAALAHANLVASTPAPNAKASGVRTLSLTFSEAVVETLSGVKIVMTGMPGMANHDPMKVSGFQTALGADGKTLTVTLPRALPVGTYKLDWHAVTADTHRIEGSYAFSVK